MVATRPKVLDACGYVQSRISVRLSGIGGGGLGTVYLKVLYVPTEQMKSALAGKSADSKETSPTTSALHQQFNN